MNATVIGNLSTQPDPVNAFAGFHAVQGAVQAADHTTTLNLKLGGAGAEQNDFADGAGITVDVAFQRATSPMVGTFTLSQGASGVASPTETVVANNNDNSPALTFSLDPVSVVGSVPALPAATDQTCSPPPLLFAPGGIEKAGVAPAAFVCERANPTSSAPAASSKKFPATVAASPCARHLNLKSSRRRRQRPR